MTRDKPHLLMVGPYQASDMPPLEAAYHIHKLWEGPDRGTVLAGCGDVRAIATKGDLGADGAMIAALPRLEIIACYGVGTDAIDLGAARARGIAVTNTPDVLTEDVADMAMALTLAALRRVPAAETHVRSGRWGAGPFPLVRRFHGCRFGIVGYGRIGAAIARRATGFGVEVGYYARTKRPACGHRYFSEVAALATWCDVMVVAVAGGPGTKAIVDARAIAALGPEGFLVNVSRGSTVDEAALLEALERRRLGGAGLDVFDNEPSIDPRFLALDNAVLQPHHGSGTIETRRVMGRLVTDNLEAHFAGRPLLTPVH